MIRYLFLLFPYMATAQPISSPPNGDLRAMAEWEEVSNITLSWEANPNDGFHDILLQIAKEAASEVIVINVCDDTTQVRNRLMSEGISLDNQRFIKHPVNTLWIRDYGQWNVYRQSVDSLLLIDFIYNRNRPQDNIIPFAIATFKDLQIHSMNTPPYDLVHTGGNLMVDGLGRAFSSKLVVEENNNGTFNITDRNEAGILDMMNQFLGIEDYVLMDNLPYDGIHHIDMHMKLLNEHTLLVGEYPQGKSDGPQIEANLLYILNDFQPVWDSPYKVVRVPMPPDQFNDFPDEGGYYRTYTNSLIINKKILVPIYEEEYDSTALRIYRENMPGYEIVGIDCNDIIPLSGAIHCITKEIGVNDPLWISHIPPAFIEGGGEPNTMQFITMHRSGINFSNLHFGYHPDSIFQVKMLTPVSDTFSQSFTFENRDTLYYYITSTAVSGKSISKPLTAPSGFWKVPIRKNINIAAADLGYTHSRLFPNPATALTVLEFQIAGPHEAQIFITDIAGRKVADIFSGELQNGLNRFFFDAGNLSAGMFFVNIINDKGKSETLKLFVN